MDFEALERELERLEREIPARAQEGLRAAAEDGVAYGKAQSSGPFSQAELDRYDNPYAVRHGSPLLPPEEINEQTGEFKENWQVETAGDGTVQVVNRSRVADFLVGKNRPKSTMFRRPVDDSVEEYLQDQAPKRVAEELRRL